MTIRLLGQIRYRYKSKSTWTKWHYYYTDENYTLCKWPLRTNTHTREVALASFNYPDMRCKQCMKKLNKENLDDHITDGPDTRQHDDE